MDQLTSLLARLERVTDRLERVDHQQPPAAPVTSPATPQASGLSQIPTPQVPVSIPQSSTEVKPGDALGDSLSSTQAFDMYLAPAIAGLLERAQPLGAEVTSATGNLKSGLEVMKTVVDTASSMQQADQGALQSLVRPVVEKMEAAEKLTKGKRTANDNHYKAVSECLQALSFLVFTPGSGMPEPIQYVAESLQSAEFYLNKILVEFRSKDENQVEWAKAVKETMINLQTYIKAAGLTRGLKFGVVPAASGSSTAVTTPAAPPSTAAGPRPPPPPPPPPPPGYMEAQLKKSAGGAPPGPSMADLLKDLNKGTDITSGLKKVTPDMKNKGVSGSVSETQPAASHRPSSAAPKQRASGPTRFELEQGRKWVVENHTDNRDIVISETNPKQIVYIYGCSNSLVQVNGKVNTISLDKCTKTGIIFEDVIAQVEIVNCSSVQIQCKGKAPLVSIDKCDGVQVYVSKEVAQNGSFQVVTAKSSEVNVTVMPEGDEEPAEHPVPEQFLSSFKNGKLVTEAVSHTGV